MTKLLIAALAIATLFAIGLAVHAPAEAAPTCGASPSATGQFPAMSVRPGVYITGVCVTINGHTQFLTDRVSHVYGGCYVVYKAATFVSVAADAGFFPTCPPIGLTLRRVGSVGH